MQAEELERLGKFYEAEIINSDLNKIYKELVDQTKQEKKPDSIIGRVVVDTFGLIVLYFLLFTLCDFTRAVITDSTFFGFKWLFFGPYYFFTKAPLMTRIWKSKKFLEDLSEAKSGGLVYDPQKTCTQEGEIYKAACNLNQANPHKHPVRDHMGDGMDWIIRHTIGKSFGGILGNSNCEDQSTTVAYDCANERLMKAWDCYQFVCDQYDLPDRAPTIDYPNVAASYHHQIQGWSSQSANAYLMYYEIYIALYDIGSDVIGDSSRPRNLNTSFDSNYNYCYSGATLFITGFVPPPWWIAEGGFQKEPCYFQDNYTNHLLDYWDPV